MEEKKIFNLFYEDRVILRAVLDYFSLKNKVLWEGDKWQSGTKVILGINDYKTLMVYPWPAYNGIELERTNDTTFAGEGMVANISADQVHTSVGVVIKIMEGDVASFTYRVYMHHNGGANHNTYGTAWLQKIVGREPLLPAVLQKSLVTLLK